MRGQLLVLRFDVLQVVRSVYISAFFLSIHVILYQNKYLVDTAQDVDIRDHVDLDNRVCECIIIITSTHDLRYAERRSELQHYFRHPVFVSVRPVIVHCTYSAQAVIPFDDINFISADNLYNYNYLNFRLLFRLRRYAEISTVVELLAIISWKADFWRQSVLELGGALLCFYLFSYL